MPHHALRCSLGQALRITTRHEAARTVQSPTNQPIWRLLMTRRTAVLRLCSLAAVLFGLMAVYSPTTASAQIKCVCKAIAVYSADNIPCAIPICVLDANGTVIHCESIKPGVATKLPCIDGGSVAFKTCFGDLVTITEDCVFNVPLGPGCCVDACLGYDENGCAYIKIGPSAVKCKCP